MRQHMLDVKLIPRRITHVLDVKLIPRHFTLQCLSSQALQVLITDSLQAVLPPNTTIGQVNMMQQLGNDTVIVSTQFSIWESQLPILLANKCCALEALYLQYAVERVSPSTTGEPAAIDGRHVHHCTLSEEHISSSLSLFSEAASEGNIRLNIMSPASQCNTQITS